MFSTYDLISHPLFSRPNGDKSLKETYQTIENISQVIYNQNQRHLMFKNLQKTKNYL